MDGIFGDAGSFVYMVNTAGWGNIQTETETETSCNVTTAGNGLIQGSAVITRSSIHKRHPIVYPLERGIGCLLWVQPLTDILPQFQQLFMQYLTILDRVIMALDCMSTSTPWLRQCAQSERQEDFGARSRYLGHASVITSLYVLWDVITYTCPRYLLLAPRFSLSG